MESATYLMMRRHGGLWCGPIAALATRAYAPLTLLGRRPHSNQISIS